MRTLILFLATGAYSGYAPVASGTVGTLVAIPLILLSAQLFSFSVALHLVTIVLAIAGACWVAGVADRELGEHDSGKIVIDEFMGFLSPGPWTWWACSRLFFAFDIVNRHRPATDRRAGWYRCTDDVVGLYTNLLWGYYYDRTCAISVPVTSLTRVKY
jgi:phosphatidylglycerophosphatase A